MFTLISHPVAIAVMVFSLRIIDVSLGTMRTIMVVRGHTAVAMALGFVEVTIWVLAVTPVVMGVREQPFLAIAFAGGFATGNAAGITLERKLALGTVVVRLISRRPGAALSALVAGLASGTAVFEGAGLDGPRTLLYASCPRKNLNTLLQVVRKDEPDLFYVVERFSQTGSAPLPDPTGWRAIFKRK